jgi:hypothetical protein
MAYYSPYTYETNSSFYIPPFNNNQHYSYILDNYIEPPPTPTQYEGQDYQSVNYAQPHSNSNLAIHPSSAAAQLGLTREEIQEVLEDQGEWMRGEEEQEQREGGHNMAEETHQQQQGRDDNTDMRTATLPLGYVARCTTQWMSTTSTLCHSTAASSMPTCNEYRRELVTLIPQVHWTSFYCEIAKVLGTVWWLKV